jgi:hypothetical protein
MQPARSQFTKVDELALAALVAHRSSRASLSEEDTLLELELVEHGGDVDECAVTGRFSRHAMPYEDVEIAPLRDGLAGRRAHTSTSTFAHTVRRPEVDGTWFDLPEAALIALEAPVPEPATPWRWLAAAIAATALALPIAWLLCSALPSLLK